MEPMPTLEGAVHPPRVDPPTWSERHPRAKAGIDLLFPAVWVVLLVMRLQRDGFDWLVVTLLVLAAGVGGARLAQFPRRAGTPETPATH